MISTSIHNVDRFHGMLPCTSILIVSMGCLPASLTCDSPMCLLCSTFLLCHSGQLVLAPSISKDHGCLCPGWALYRTAAPGVAVWADAGTALPVASALGED